MRHQRTILVFCAVLIGTCVADGDPGRVLKKAVKTTLKTDNFRVGFEAVGGFANGPEHELIERHVQATVEARTYGRLTAIDAPIDAFRVDGADNGTIDNGDRWIMLSAALPSQRIPERLFLPVSRVLNEAAALKKSAVWLDEGERIRVEGTSKLAVALFNEFQQSGCFAESPQNSQTQGAQSGGGGC